MSTEQLPVFVFVLFLSSITGTYIILIVLGRDGFQEDVSILEAIPRPAIPVLEA